MKYNPMELSDFYKQGHEPMYPKGLTYLATYMTPRMSRMETEDKLTVFGTRGFCEEYLIEVFNEGFFKVNIEELLKEMNEDMAETFTRDYIVTGKVAELHKLGYLPVRVWSLPEGTRSPVNTRAQIEDCIKNGKEIPLSVPVMMIENTHPDFAWVVEFLESISSCQLWRSMCIANVGYKYRQIVNKHWEKSVVEQPACTAVSEFGFRGEETLESAVQASAAFLLSFNKTATIPAIKYLQRYYSGNIKNGGIASGMISTEHSVMCSNFAIDNNEDDFLIRLFRDIYPNGNISVVLDSYDYWGRVKAIGTHLKKYVLGRKGTLFIRGDSGDPVEIVCGTGKYKPINSIEDITPDATVEWTETALHYYRVGTGKNGEPFKYVEVWNTSNGMGYRYIEPELSDIGTVEALFNYYGGTVNSKGFIVLYPSVRAIYGDSITPARCDRMYDALEDRGFAANNVALGAGSFSMQCMEENGLLLTFTRDSYGIAVKATYCEVNGVPYVIFKDPNTDTGRFKKSQKGLVYVYMDEDGTIKAKDGYTRATFPTEGNLMQVIFENGKMVVRETLDDIRNRLHAGNF